MPNVFQLNKYNPTMWAQAALEHLTNSLGMSRRVYWGYASERSTAGHNLGDTVTITVPGLLTATTDPDRGPEDLITSSRSISLNKYAKTDFRVTDKDLAYGGDQIFEDHIKQAMFRVVEHMDNALMGMASKIPTRIAADGTTPSNDLANGRVALFENGVKVDWEDIHYAIDSTAYGDLLKSGIYNNTGIAGNAATNTLIRGSLDERYGVSPFAMQTAGVSHTCGTIATQGAPETAALVGAHDVSGTILSIDGATPGLTIKPGDSLVIEGSSQKYVATTDVTVGGGGTASVGVWPPLPKNYEDDAVVTFDETPVSGGAYKGLPMFNNKAFAIVPAPLPKTGAEIGSVRMDTATDPETGLSIRATLSYQSSGIGAVIVKYDALFGIELIDPNRAILVCR